MQFEKTFEVSQLSKLNRDILIVEVLNDNLFRTRNFKSGYQKLSQSSIVRLAEVERQMVDDAASKNLKDYANTAKEMVYTAMGISFLMNLFFAVALQQVLGMLNMLQIICF